VGPVFQIPITLGDLFLLGLLADLVLGTTVLFELIGPVGTRLALRRTGEAGRAST